MSGVAHAGFTLEREYPHPVKAVWSAFAEEAEWRDWFGRVGEREQVGEWSFDFRVGGTTIAESEFHGVRSRYVATITDLVEHDRIILTYDLWIDGVHISTSVVSYEFEPVEGGTRFTHAEHGIHLDGFDMDGAMREHGTRLLLDELGRSLDRRFAGA